MTKNTTIELGALAPKLAGQLKGFKIKKDALEYLQGDADAITRVIIRGLATDSQGNMMRKKLMKKIQSAVTSAAAEYNKNKSKKEKQ